MNTITDQYSGIAIMYSQRNRLTGEELAELSKRIEVLQSQIRTLKKYALSPDLSIASEFSSEWDGTNASELDTIDTIMTNLQEKQQAVSEIQSNLQKEQQVSKNRSSTIKSCLTTQAQNLDEIAGRNSKICRRTPRTKVLSSTENPLHRQPGE